MQNQRSITPHAYSASRWEDTRNEQHSAPAPHRRQPPPQQKNTPWLHSNFLKITTKGGWPIVSYSTESTGCPKTAHSRNDPQLRPQDASSRGPMSTRWWLRGDLGHEGGIHNCVLYVVLMLWLIRCKCAWDVCSCKRVLSMALPWYVVVQDSRAAVSNVLQSRVWIVEGWRVVLLRDVVWIQVGDSGRKHTGQSYWRSKHEITAVYRSWFCIHMCIFPDKEMVAESWIKWVHM